MQQIDFNHFLQIVQQASDAMFSTDKDLIVTSWNAAAEKLYGFKEKEVIGAKLGTILKSSPEQLIDVIEDLDVLQENGFQQGEYCYTNKFRETIYIQASVTVLRGSDGNISGYVARHRNISERKMEEKLTTLNAGLEEQVKEKAAQLTIIFERITDAFVALDSKECYTYMNKRAGELLNRDPATMIGKHIWTEFPEGIGQPFYHAYREAMSKQHHIHLEEYYPPYNRWFENDIYPSPEGLSIFFRDITANKQIEEDARSSNQRLLLHLTNSPLASIEWNTDSVITSWSGQAEAIFEWTKEEAVGKTIEELNLVFAEDVDKVALVILALVSGSTTRLKFTNRNNTKTGRIIYCEWYNSVLKDDRGAVVSGLSLVQDVTEKQRAEEALTFNEQQLNLIYNSSSDILYLLSVEQNEKFKFISINDAFKKATGLKSEQIIDKYVEEVVPYPSSQLVLEKYKYAIEIKDTVQWEEVTSYPTGIKTGLVSITPVFNNNNDVCISLVGSVHDITENKRAEVELLEKNDQLRNLSAHLQDIREEERANIAREIHDELGERLTGIRLDISWIENQLLLAKPVKDKFRTLIQLVDDTIKTVRKISTELRPSILDDFGLVDALEWQAAEFEKRTGISCKVSSFINEHLSNKKIEITLFRVFQESLTNVVRHAKARHVVAELLKQKNTINFIIKDDGVGMDMDKVKGEQTLGLVGMKERVLMVNGTFNVTSEIGSGTIVTVSVPLE
jgi:PAS domain S-box-containing protein